MRKLFFSLSLLASSMVMNVAAQEYVNPVISGFNPDPSICRVGDDYYVVNSSFQYFPGVPIYHSKDLVNWEQIGNVLNRDSQLPLKGASSWLGIYAPTLRYNDGIYYMVTTNVGNGGNFFVTATRPEGPWSEPVWLEQQGIDPSLYFEDGKCYLVSNPDNNITLCEIDAKTGKQLSESKSIWRGTGGRYPEGPHIYKKDGYYYLLISEGGTELAHKLTIARSRDIYGPYESNPANPIFTHCCMAAQGSVIQGTGHGDFVEAADGSWWITFLAFRFHGGSYHHLGRETFLAPVEWNAGEWPVVNGNMPVDTLMRVATLPLSPVDRQLHRGRFPKTLGAEWVHIQNPVASNYRLHNGVLELKGAASLTLNDHPTFVGIRQTRPVMSVETLLDCSQMGNEGRAGITVYQINDGHADLFCEGGDAVLRCRMKSLDVELGRVKDVLHKGKCRLRMEADKDRYRFLCKKGDEWQEVGSLECSLLSTEVVGGFTGVVLGLYAEGDGVARFQSFDEY